MFIKQFLILIAILVINLINGLCHNNKIKNIKSSPNILLIIIDDLRPAINSFGDTLAITPNIDRIAETGTIFTNAFAQQALCGPSRTSFLTSRRPDTTRLVDVHYYWRTHAGNYSTLPQYFKENGYFTQSVGKVFHPGISSNNSDDQPYSWSEQPYHPSSQKFKNAAVCPSIDGKLHANIYCPVQVDKQLEKTLPDIQSTKFALKWLHERAKCVDQLFGQENASCSTTPFLLTVGFHKPHIPLKFPMEFLDLYPIDRVPLAPHRHKPNGLPLVAWNPWNDLRRRDDIASLNLSFPFGPMPDFYSKYIKQGYYAATSYTDSLLGLIVSLTWHLFPNTIVAALGDHGWSLGEHQEWSKFSNYDIATKVPFIISLPPKYPYNNKRGMKYILKEAKRLSVSPRYFKKYIKYNKINLPARRNAQDFEPKKYAGVVELLDLFPTMVDLAGLPPIPKCPSYSFNISTCTEGMSLSCIVNTLHKRQLLSTNNHKKLECPRKFVSLSQYPRPGVIPSTKPDSDQPRLTETNIMGYSLRTDRYRYTSWLKFNHSNFHVEFNNTFGGELYDHMYDNEENNNLINTEVKISLKMKELLRAKCELGEN